MVGSTKQHDYVETARSEEDGEVFSVPLTHLDSPAARSRWYTVGLTSAVGSVVVAGLLLVAFATCSHGNAALRKSEHAPLLGLAAVDDVGQHEQHHKAPHERSDAHSGTDTGIVDDTPENKEQHDGHKCSAYGENCWITRCCTKSEHTCFMKDGAWAGCLESCEMGVHDSDPKEVQTPWTCFRVQKEGPALPPHDFKPKRVELPEPKLPGPPAVQAEVADGKFPTLFCFAVIRSKTYELDLVRKQLELKGSYFACEDWAILSDDQVDIGQGVKTISIGSLETGNGVRTHFANTGIFSRAFDKLKDEGRMMARDFVVKLDPDAVFFPARLKAQIRLQVKKPDFGSPGPNIYFQNCLFQNRLWMFGAVEVLSHGALETYFRGRDTTCKAALDYDNMGEDTFLSRCLDYLGVEAHKDFSLLSDGYCDEAPGTCKSSQVTYHPFKDPVSWEACFRSAENSQ